MRAKRHLYGFGLVFVLMGVGVIAYVAGVFMIEDIIAFVK